MENVGVDGHVSSLPWGGRRRPYIWRKNLLNLSIL